MCSGPRYATYHAQCWASCHTDAEILAEIAACEYIARTHHWQWNEVGNSSDTWTRVDTLRRVLGERAADGADMLVASTTGGLVACAA
jgi:hypothetical protein